MRKIFLVSILTMLLSIELSAQKLNIVFIGNSITQGALVTNPAIDAPPAKCAQILENQGYVVQFANMGVSGSTTVDHLPATNTLFAKTKQAADKLAQQDGELIFSIMLGTNDSAISGPNGAPVQAVQYYVNLKSITDELISLYPKCRIIIHHPLWYSLNTYNAAMYLKAGLQRLRTYRAMIDKIALDNRAIYVGDTEGYDFFEKNHRQYYFAEDGQAGTFYLHPNEEGATKLAQYWAQAISRIIN